MLGGGARNAKFHHLNLLGAALRKKLIFPQQKTDFLGDINLVAITKSSLAILTMLGLLRKNYQNNI